LLTGSAREVLARIVPDDPLGLRARIGACLRARALLCDAERVLLRAQAEGALRAPAWRGEPELEIWLAERVEDALAALLVEPAPERECLEGFALFATPLALDARALASGCARFNRLPHEQREAFVALVLDASAGPDRLARARGQSLTELLRGARGALELFRASASCAVALPADPPAPDRSASAPSGPAADVLGWLLPEAGAPERQGLRRVITALRLLRDDARLPAERRAPPSWVRARTELERLERRQRRRAIEGLLHAHLAALRSPDSFLDLGPGAAEPSGAWRVLLGAGLPGFPPAPGEPVSAVVERLLAAGERCGARPAWRDYWEACRRHVTGSAADAARRWEALLRAGLVAGARPGHLARLLGGALAAALERGEPGRALELCARHGALLGHEPARHLGGWSALLCGELARARALLAGGEPVALPRPLEELRADVPALGELLPGARAAGAAASGPPLASDRRALGALALGVFALRADGSAERLALDAGAEVRSEAAGVRAVAPHVDQESVHRQRRVEAAQPPLPGALAVGRTRALARVAVRASDGALAGWIQVECAHQLLPSAERLRGLARAWGGTVLARRAVLAPGRPSSARCAPSPSSRAIRGPSSARACSRP
jgi:hypothetical protein